MLLLTRPLVRFQEVPPSWQAARAVAVAAHRAQRHELADAMVGVHHVVADLEVAQGGEEGAVAAARGPPLQLGLRQQLLLAVDRDAGGRQPEAAGELAAHQLDAALPERHLAPFQQLLGAPAVHRRHHHQAALAARPRRRQLLREARQLAVKEIGHGGVEVHHRPLGASGTQDEIGRGSACRQSRHSLQVDQYQRRRRQRAHHRGGRLLERFGRRRQAAGIAARREIGLEPRRVVLGLGVQRRRIDREHQRVGQRLEQRHAVGQQRQVVLPAREGAGAAEALEQLRPVRSQVGLLDEQQVREPGGLLGAAGEQVEGQHPDRL